MTEMQFPSPSYEPLTTGALRSLEAIDPNLVNSLLYGLAKQRDFATLDNVIEAGLLGEPGAPSNPILSRARILVNSVNVPNPDSASFARQALDRILAVFGQDEDWLAMMLAQAARTQNVPLMKHLYAAGADPHRPVRELGEKGASSNKRYISAAAEAMRAKLPFNDETSSILIAPGKVHLIPCELSPDDRMPVPCSTLLDQAVSAGLMEWGQAIVSNLAPGEGNRLAMGQGLVHASGFKNAQVAAALLCLGAQPPGGDLGWQTLTGLRKSRKDEPASLAAQIIFDINNTTLVQHDGRYIGETAIEVLLQQGLDPNLTDRLGRTLLDSAVASGNEAIVSSLLLAGADPHAKSGENTLEDLADTCGHKHLIPLLQSWKARKAIEKVLRQNHVPAL